MSFRCEFCSEAQPSGTASKLVTIKTRMRNPEMSEIAAYGSEIVQEKRVCPSCFLLTKIPPDPPGRIPVDERFDKSTVKQK